MDYKITFDISNELLHYIDYLACSRAMRYDDVIRSILNEDYERFKEKIKKEYS